MQACPTYLVLEDENDSPRGRLLLMRAVLEGELALTDPAVSTHLDRCLGCRGCESACPSGVPYGHLLEAARETMAQQKPLPPVARAMLMVFARPHVLAIALGAARWLRATGLPRVLARAPGRLGFANAMLAATTPGPKPTRYLSPTSSRRGRVGVLAGCVMEGLFTATNRATERTLDANGYAIIDVPGAHCCGALHLHAGDAETARTLARINIAAFERAGLDAIAVNASGCGAAMKEYGTLLDGDPIWRERAHAVASKVKDATELLADAGPRSGFPVTLTVTYDAPCHLLHAQRVTGAPLAVLRAIPGLTIIPLVDAEQCCGSAGIYNLVQPAVSDAVLTPKLNEIERTRASVVATGNPGCLMQIGAGLLRRNAGARAMHPIDLLDASYAAAPTSDA
jgi:glycolate oxidase iron-sulfur subunit